MICCLNYDKKHRIVLLDGMVAFVSVDVFLPNVVVVDVVSSTVLSETNQ